MSDLHIDFWQEHQQVDWTGLGTSLVAIVAGDICRDWQQTYEYLNMLTDHYRHVLYTDGNHEHNMNANIRANSDRLHDRLFANNHITYLHRNSIILDNTAFIGSNGWWTFDFAEPEMSRETAWHKLMETGFTEEFQASVMLNAKQDAMTLCNLVKQFDPDPLIQDIVVVTHSAPIKQARWVPPGMPWEHYARAGNSQLQQCLTYNLNRKIRAWCFGHVHVEIDVEIDGIRYLCHPRGTPPLGSEIYYPKLVRI